MYANRVARQGVVVAVVLAGAVLGFAKAASGTSAAVGVVVVAAGWSEHYGTEVSYGIVLKNLSRSQDATGVTATVLLVSAGGSVLARDSQTISLVPANTTFYLGNDDYVFAPGRVGHLRVTVVTAKMRTKHLALPGVLTARLAAGGNVKWW
jgi:hypothetical protein